MTRREFGRLEDGTVIEEVVLASAAGAEARIITWGAAVRDLHVPGRSGRQRVVLGLESLDDYVRHSRHFGATTGRFANRIRAGRFTLDGREYQLPCNQDGKHSLHGGGNGFGRSPWRITTADARSVTMTIVSPDGEHGYPGRLEASITYRLEEPATLAMMMTAVTDKPTPVNLLHHSYFNLDGSKDVLDHTLEIAADFYAPTDAENMPTGEIRRAAGSGYDFRSPRPVRGTLEGRPARYDLNYLLRRPDRGRPDALMRAARLASEQSGIALEVWTTEPSIQLYDGHKLEMPVPGLGGVTYGPCSGLCLEPQRYPDSPNIAHFPSPVLRPGETYRQQTELRFSVR